MAKYFTKEGDDLKEVDAFSQTEVDEIVTKRLDRERGKFADYEDLKEKAGKVETVKAEYEGKLKAAGTEKTELEKQLGAAKLETDKVKIVNEFKLPDDLAEFVTGETADEMRKRAEKLSKGVKGGKLDIDKKPKPDGVKTDNKAIAGKLFGKKSDD